MFALFVTQAFQTKPLINFIEAVEHRRVASLNLTKYQMKLIFGPKRHSRVSYIELGHRIG